MTEWDKEDAAYQAKLHEHAMEMWRDIGRKYWLNQARRAWREIVRRTGPLS